MYSVCIEKRFFPGIEREGYEIRVWTKGDKGELKNLVRVEFEWTEKKAHKTRDRLTRDLISRKLVIHPGDTMANYSEEINHG